MPLHPTPAPRRKDEDMPTRGRERHKFFPDKDREEDKITTTMMLQCRSFTRRAKQEEQADQVREEFAGEGRELPDADELDAERAQHNLLCDERS